MVVMMMMMMMESSNCHATHFLDMFLILNIRLETYDYKILHLLTCVTPGSRVCGGLDSHARTE